MDAALVLDRLLAFAAGVTLFGAPLFVLYAGPGEAAAPRGLRRLGIAAAGLAMAAAAVGLVVQTGQMAGDPGAGIDPGALRDVLFGSGFGASIVARLVAAGLALALLGLGRRSRSLWAVTAALGAVDLSALAWAGHGAADEGPAGLAHTAADVVHLLAAGVWLGALVAFGMLALVSRRDRDVMRPLQVALARFSGIGSLAVALLVASGVVNGWFLVGPEHLGDLLTSPWGQVLLIKLGLFAAMLGFAALNRFRLTPRLAASLAGDPAAVLAAVRRSVLSEGAVGLAVLIAVAILGVLEPPASM